VIETFFFAFLHWYSASPWSPLAIYGTHILNKSKLPFKTRPHRKYLGLFSRDTSNTRLDATSNAIEIEIESEEI